MTEILSRLWKSSKALTLLLSDGGADKGRVIRSALEAAERSSRWLWIKGREQYSVSATGTKARAWSAKSGSPGAMQDVWGSKPGNTPNDPSIHHWWYSQEYKQHQKLCNSWIMMKQKWNKKDLLLVVETLTHTYTLTPAKLKIFWLFYERLLWFTFITMPMTHSCMCL